MNYLIWKNIDSRTLKGLIISELPPITKPPMRVQETTIEGVDGSIIEDIGYEAYDKKILIGLSRNFDIDEIIKYFSGEGNIVFSNEPDKYYKAKIIEQIDYERLVRFRTASITFRVQPFKYEYQEEECILPSNQLKGTHISYSEPNTKFVKFEMDGYCHQDSMPTAETEAPIKTIEESIKINISGKNLLNINKINQGTTIAGKSTDDYGILEITETGIQTTILKELEAGVFIGSIEVTGLKVGTQYILSAVASSTFSQVYMYKDKLWGKTESSGNINDGIKFTPTTSNIIIGFYSQKNIIGETKKIENIQLEEGSVITKYEKYKGNQIIANLGDEFLGEVGNIKDTFYINNGRLYLEKKIGKAILNGNSEEEWVIATAGEYKYFANVKTAEERNGKANTENLLSNRFLQNKSYNADNTIKTGYKWFIQLTYRAVETVEQFKSYLSENNLVVYYELEEPYMVDLGEIETIEFLDGENIISNNQTANMILSYIVDNLIVNNIGNYEAKPVIKITGSGTIEFRLNNNTLFRYTFPEGEDTVVIDSQKQDAYLGTVLKNRNMSGEFPVFKTGENIITWEGSIESIEITSRSRWL